MRPIDDCVRYFGNDPYDALRSPLLPSFVRENARLRQVVIQVRKRSPLDLAPALRIAPFLMAKALGCFLSCSSRLASVGEGGDDLGGLADLLLCDSTIARVAAGGWGYEFDVQTRWAFYPAGSPNVIATTFVGRGLLEAALVSGRDDLLASAQAAAGFISSRLHSTAGYFLYTPTSEALVHNANLLAAGFVASVGALTGDGASVDRALGAAQSSLTAQRSDGAWVYGAEPGLGWIDNFHTAYDLDGLLLLWLATRDSTVGDALRRGVEFWRGRLFDEGWAPRYYDDHAMPREIHSAATAVDVAARLGGAGFGTEDLALGVAAWTERNLIRNDGTTTYFRKTRMRTDKRHFVRWGDAHWALARGSLAVLKRDCQAPIESRLLEKGASE